jgi:hypothetical protein
LLLLALFVQCKKRLKKSKNIFCTCVLDFNFAPIKGSVFFIFKKKSNLLYPIVHVHPQFFNANQDYILLSIRDVYLGFKIFDTNSHTNIKFYEKNTCCSKYLLQSKYLLKIFSYLRIFASKYSFRSEYSQKFNRISHSKVSIHLPLVEDPRSGKNLAGYGSMGSKKHWIPDPNLQHWDYSILFIFIYFIYIF